MVVEGTLEHSISGQFDDRMKYRCVSENGEEVEHSVNIEQRSLSRDYKDAGRTLIKEICHDAFIEFGG